MLNTALFPQILQIVFVIKVVLAHMDLITKKFMADTVVVLTDVKEI